ncbi:MAG: ABC transporter ATP-binding protein [Verrucomicrobiota bacterium]
MELRWRIIRYYLPYRGRIALALLCLAATVGLNLLKPWPTAWVIDEVLPQTAATQPEVDLGYTAWAPGIPEAILGAALALLAIYLLASLSSLGQELLVIRIGLKALLRLRTELFHYLQKLPLVFHHRNRTGDSTYRVAYDAQAIQTFFHRGFANVISSLATLALTFAIMWQMDVWLALLALGIVPVLWITIYLFAERIRAQTAAFQQEESEVLSRASESLGSIRVVHAFGREEHETAAFRQEATQSYLANRRLLNTNAVSTLAVGVIMGGGLAVMLYFGAYAVLDGRLRVGELFVFLSYLAMLYQPLEQLSYTAWAMEGATAEMQRVFEVLDIEDAVPEKAGAPPLPAGEGAVRLENVTFGYEEDKPVLHGVSLEARPGETVAVVGGTGCGKTTVLSLIPRFFDPNAGRILIDGHDIREHTKASVRARSSFVLQDTILLSGTIMDNIAYGREGATQAEIIDAARRAQAHDFIRQLPYGYHTEVGERGVRLSGGQRQRIGIARAFLKQAPLLLLDEPTSALDMETEAELMHTLRDLMDAPTTLIVTHRLRTIHHVDRIYVLEDGRLAESGTGPELLEKGGVYARLYNQDGAGKTVRAEEPR